MELGRNKKHTRLVNVPFNPKFVSASEYHDCYSTASFSKARILTLIAEHTLRTRTEELARDTCTPLAPFDFKKHDRQPVRYREGLKTETKRNVNATKTSEHNCYRHRSRTTTEFWNSKHWSPSSVVARPLHPLHPPGPRRWRRSKCSARTVVVYNSGNSSNSSKRRW